MTLILLVLAALFAHPALASPPPSSDPSPEAHAWFQNLRDARGISCCAIADCRRTAVRSRGDGGVEAWIGKEQYSAGAPDAWLPVPAGMAKSRGNRPPGVVGAIACYYNGAIHCVDLNSGM